MIDLIYLNEAKRIRKEYLENLTNIVDKEDEIKMYLEKLNEIQSQIDEYPNKDDEKYKNSLLELNRNINKINDYIKIYYDKITQLDKDQRLLYERIKDKYPNINDEELKSDIMNYIDSVNQNFLNKVIKK